MARFLRQKCPHSFLAFLTLTCLALCEVYTKCLVTLIIKQLITIVGYVFSVK